MIVRNVQGGSEKDIVRTHVPSWFIHLMSGLFGAQCALLARLAHSIRRRHTELGGLIRPSTIINYLQVLKNNNTKKL